MFIGRGSCRITHDTLHDAEFCEDGDVRLIGGNTKFEGRVEMCYKEDFGTICDLGFGRLEAGVVCSQLGFSRMGMIFVAKCLLGVWPGLCVAPKICMLFCCCCCCLLPLLLFCWLLLFCCCCCCFGVVVAAAVV